MSDPYAAAERFALSYFSAGEEHLGGRPSDDIFRLAAHDLEELTADGPTVAVVAMLQLLDVAVDFIVELAGRDRAAVVRSLVAAAERRRAAT